MQPQSPRVVYIVESPLSERDAARFGLEVLQQHGFAVEAWEVDALFLPHSRKQAFVPAVGWTVRSITSVDELRQCCAGLSAGDVVISLCGFYRGQARTHAPLRVALRKCPAQIAAVSVGVRPARSLTLRGLVQDIRTHPRRALSSVRGTARRRWDTFSARAASLGTRTGEGGGTPILDWLFVATSSTDVDPRCIGNGTRIMAIHSLDIDLVLQQRVIPASRGSYLLFFDSMGPLHPDYETLNLKRGPTTAPEYFSIVRDVLLRVQELVGLPVKVAAHPRAPVGMLDPLYGPLPVTYGETPALVASARAVLMAFPSTAIGMAVVFRRPMTIISSERFDPFVREETEVFTPLLALDVINADRPLSAWRVPAVPEHEYRRYEQQFVQVPGAPRLPFWEVVAKALMPHSS